MNTHIHGILVLCIALTVQLFSPFCDASPKNKGEDGRVQHDTMTYRTVDDQELTLHLFRTKDRDPEEDRPGIMLIHGGGWKAGSPDLFFPHARYFARRGMVAMVPQYRLVDEQKDIAVSDAALDCRYAFLFAVDHAGELGLLPEKIAVAGDSAGGHLAAVVALMEEIKGERPQPEVNPGALILFGAITNTAEGKWEIPEGESLSPVHNVGEKAPPTLVIHGEEDPVVSVGQARAFAVTMEDKKNHCALMLMPETKHAFVLPGYGKPEEIKEAMARADNFLAEIGYLEGDPDESALDELANTE